MSPTEPPGSSEPPEPPSPWGEPPPDFDQPDAGAERWKAVQPKSNWRQETKTGFLARYPFVAVGLVVVLVVGAGLAIVGALRSRHQSSAAGAVSGVLQVGVVGLPSLDPADARDPQAVMVVDQLFDTLVRDGRDLQPVPELARAFEANAAQTVFTFHLAPGLRFDDGSPITAADVKFTLERIARKGSDSPLAAHLESVTGYAAWHSGGTAAGLSGVETPDPATVVVRLDQPFSSFPAVLGHPGFGIVPKAAVERLGDAFKQTPVGSGPFRRVDSPAAGRLSLRRAAGRIPEARLDGIDFVDFKDAAAAYAALQAKSIDVAPVPAAEPGRGPLVSAKGKAMPPYLGLVFYGLNVKSPDLADPRFRQAIALAIDRQEIVDDVYQGAVGLATGLVADGVPRRAADACGDRCRHDPDRARALLAEAFPDGRIPEVSIDHDDDATQAAVAARIKTDLDTVGIPCVLRPHPFAEYGQFLVSGQQELFRLGWIADYPSADAFLTPLFRSTSPDNLTGLSDPEIDQTLAAARVEGDPARRLALYLKAEQLVLDQYVVVPIGQLENRMVAASRVKGFALDPIGTFDGVAVSVPSK
ncbi:MAG TPA: ABC transporter substrate-binding protein [Acidimicrobiia bacterium]|nr:ABC transporter substrate-binding protein [Acidimicrobiia bacterium]